jgi:hypothetical protein
MSVELRGGPEQLARISRQLREEANRGLQRELNRELSRAAAPFRQELPKSAMDRLPDRGGLNQYVARARVSVRNRAARGQGVRITVGGRRSQIDQINRGFVIHPVFGSDVRVRQAIPAGYADEAMRNTEDDVNRGMQKAADRVADRIDRAGRGLR